MGGSVVTGALGRARAHLVWRKQLVAGAGCSTSVKEPGGRRGWDTGDGRSGAGPRQDLSRGPTVLWNAGGGGTCGWLPGLRLREVQNRLSWVDARLGGPDMGMGRRGWASSCCLPDDTGSHSLAGYETDVTAETVRKLCDEGLVNVAVEALGVLVQTCCCVSTALFYIVLKKCVLKKDLVLGRRVHAFAVKNGHQSDEFLCNHILRMYASHGRLQDAMDVFTEVVKPNAFMWSSIISAHVKHGMDRQAIQLYHRMRDSGANADGHVFVAALQACARGLDLNTGQQVHAHVLARGLEPDLFVTSCLVDMYAKCGSLEDAEKVFRGLEAKNVVTWNAMLAGYTQQGMGQEALHLYGAMQHDRNVAPDSVTFLCLLQACAIVGPPALEQGKQLHAQIRQRGHQADVFVSSSLVNMYAKCGSLENAHSVFCELGEKDVVTWNAMIAGCSQQGKGQEALALYSVMEEEGSTVPDSVTFVCLMQACASLGTVALDTGRRLHVQIRERGHEADALVANSVVNMYSKCGSLEDAQGVFDRLSQKDIGTWTALIAGYSQQGKGQEALCLYSAMQDEGVAVPNSVTFACLLHACASVGAAALERGKQLHSQIREQGHEADVFVSSSLVNMYAKCGSLEDAQIVFDRLSKKDVVTWTALIAGYSQQGMGWKALQLYSDMLELGISVPDSVTFVCLLQACASVGSQALEKGLELHAQIRERGHETDVFAANSLVNMYAKCGSMEDAHRVFDRLDKKDVVAWNAMIAGYSQKSMGNEALQLYSDMKELLTPIPNPVTFVCLLQACASVGIPALETGKQLHTQITERGNQADVFVANGLVNMYAKCGSLEDARNVFDGLDQKDVLTWTAMIAGYSRQDMGQDALDLFAAMREEGIAPNSMTFVSVLQACASVGAPALETGKKLHVQIREQGYQADVFVASSLVNMYAKCGNLEDAQQVFDGLGEKNVVTWNALLSGYSQQGMGQEALHLYDTMQKEGHAAPDAVTFVCLLQVIADVAALSLGRQLHAQIEEADLQSDLFVAGSLIHMYGKAGSVVDAQQVFDLLPKQDVVTWSALIAGYACQGDSQAVFDLVKRMREDGIQPVGITLLSVLTVCSHAGLLKLGREYFDSMRKDHGIVPTVEHYTCMVDLLGRAGRLDEALSLVRTMSVPPSAAIWHAMLGACRKWSNVEVACHAFQEAVKIDEKDAAAYVLMSNIYMGANMCDQAKQMHAWRKTKRAWKPPGQSLWTDMDGLVHTFAVLDSRQSEQIGLA